MGKGCQILPRDVAEIAERVAGKEPLMQVLGELNISPNDFFRHLDQTPADKILFETARRVAVEVLIDECDELYQNVESRLDLERAKARVGFRQWVAEKLVPTTYGTKIQHDHAHTINIKGVLDEAQSRSKDAIEAHATKIKELEDLSTAMPAELSTNSPELSTKTEKTETSKDSVPDPEDLF